MRYLVVLALVAGCAHKPEAKNDNKTTSNTASAQPAPAATPNPVESTCSSDLDCGAKQLCIRSHCVDITADLAECTHVRVHFPLNSSDLDQSELTGLQRSARCLKADTALHVTIEGNADERGTEEYNLALGDKRATTVKRYLEALGVSDAQLATVSYGKEQPECSDHDEACWAKNRRAAVRPTSFTK